MQTAILHRKIYAILTAILMAVTPAAAQTLKIVHSFGNSTDGSQPWSAVTFDSHGNMFGTTLFGGTDGLGTVYEFSPKSGGGFTERIVHAFGSVANDGLTPYCSIAIDAQGNLYGMTPNGGTGFNGTAFELTPKAGGGYVETILHNFPGSSRDGYYPEAGLTLDSKGNLYGVALNGGVTLSGGVAFELLHAGGSWSEKVLFDFNYTDGGSPSANVTLDSAGNVYGTTFAGGGAKDGLVFKLSPSTSAMWTETILLEFGENGAQGAGPVAPLIFDAQGNLYGSVESGQIFELSPQSDGSWTQTVLYTFGGLPNAGPSGVVFDSQGNLYGTTRYGGANGYGLVFKLSPTGDGTWTETTLHDFQNDGVDGTYPIGGVTFDAAGNLWGTTSTGGAHGAGTLFVIKP
jgi:uncharacterized repeat protein (TIGR03803 family)